MTDRDFILAPAATGTSVTVDLEPAFNAINSLMLLAMPDERSGFSQWVTATAAALTPEQAHRHNLIFKPLFSAIEPRESWPSFPAYLDHLAALNPVSLRDRALEWAYCDEYRDLQPPDRATLIRDRGAYLAFLDQVYTQKVVEKEGYTPDIPLYVEAHILLNDPPALKRLIVDHLRQMWDTVLAPEWARVLPMLDESVMAFRELDYSHLTPLEAARLITGRDLSGHWQQWPEQIVFVPSAHIGPYVTRFDSDDHRITRLLFGARLPEGARVTSPALSRSELLVRLSALADDTRLRILELLTQHTELSAQDVIRILELSQSAASRHLRQLTATGFLVERRREVAKYYSLNPKRVDDTFQALKRFLRTR